MEQSFQSWLPFVNYTEMAADIDELYQKKGVEPPVGLFPRWFAQTTLQKPENADLYTTAYMIAGDSLHERKVGLAPDFPQRQLARNELITTYDVMQVLQAEVGDEIQISVSKDLCLSMGSYINQRARSE